MCLVVIFAALALTVPAMAAGDAENNFSPGAVAVGGPVNNNTGIIGNGNTMSSSTVNGGVKAYGGDADVDVNIGNSGSVFGDAKSFSPEANASIGDIDNSTRNTNMNMNTNMNSNENDNTNVNVNDNNNDNDNTNVNNNEQGQSQGQGQSQSINIEAAEIPRQFAIGTEINYPGMPGYFGPATNQPNYVKAEIITEFQKEFTREYVEAALTSHSGTSLSMKKRFHYYTGKKASADRKATDALTVTINKPEGKKVRVVGYCNIWSTSVNKDSLDVFFSALQDMLNVEGGANTVWLTGEGAMQVVKSFGWGIGLNYSHAFVNGNNDQSGNATGGTGISGGEAGYRAKPFMQLQLLIVE